MAASKPARQKGRGEGRRAARESLYRAQILDAAEQIFADRGFADTRMQDIAHSAEISLATVYQLFEGKQPLYRQILIERDRQMLARVIERVGAVFGAKPDLRAVLELLGVQIRFLLEHPAYLRMQLYEGRFWYHSETRPSADEQQLWERGLEQMLQLFTWGQSQGLFVDGEHVDLARMLLTIQQTRLANWVQAGMQEPHDTVIRRIQADFVRFFCRPAVATALLSAEGMIVPSAGRVPPDSGQPR
jgi:AcrR family transcriptional regulator